MSSRGLQQLLLHLEIGGFWDGNGVSCATSHFPQPRSPQLSVLRHLFTPDKTTAQLYRRHAGSSGAGKGVNYQIARVGAGPQASVYKRDGLLRGVLAEPLFVATGGGEAPNGLHLLAAVFGFHFLVVEGVFALAALGGFGRPQQGFGGVREAAATKVGGRIGLFPNDVVQNAIAQLHHRHAYAEVYVQRSGYPYRSRGL